MVEWSITAVLKTVELRGSGGSNPSLSARKWLIDVYKPLFLFSALNCALISNFFFYTTSQYYF